MRLVLLLALVAAAARADSLPDLVFGTAQGHHAVVLLHDGRSFFGTIASYDAQRVALVDDSNGAITPLSREEIVEVRMNDPAPQPRLVRTTPGPRLSLTSKIGLGILGTTYGLAVVGGASFLTWNRVEEDRGRDAYGPELWKQGYELFVPVVGPFLSAAASQGYPSWWQGVWIADGVAQIAGLSVLVVGLVRQQQHAAPLSFRGATFTPSVTPTSIGLSGTF